MPLWGGWWVGVVVHWTRLCFLLVISPQQSHAQALNRKLSFLLKRFSDFFLSVSKNNKTGRENTDPAWQSTLLQTTGNELCNKNSITTNVWKTKEDTGTLAAPNLQDVISDCVLIMKHHPTSETHKVSKKCCQRWLPVKPWPQKTWWWTGVWVD